MQSHSGLDGVHDQMKMSREHALLGNYEASLVYFDGVVAQIQQHLRTVDDPYLRSQWAKAKEDLVAEFGLVKEITRELARFKESPGSGAASAAAGPEEVRWDEVPVGCAAPHAPFAEPLPPDDPDVWPDPPPMPEPRRVSGVSGA